MAIDPQLLILCVIRKALWRWGENYDGVAAVADPKTSSVTLSYSSTALGDFESFW